MLLVGSLMYNMHWDELPMAGYVAMKFQDFRKAVQLERMRRNGKAMIKILITRPEKYKSIGDVWFRMRPDLKYCLRGLSGTGCGTTQVGTWWVFGCTGH